MNPPFPRHTRREWTRGLAALAVLGGLAVLAWLLYLAAVLVAVDVLPHLPGLQSIVNHLGYGDS